MHVSKIESYETAIRHFKFPFKLLCINAVRKNLDRYGGISLAMKFNLKLTFDKETKAKLDIVWVAIFTFKYIICPLYYTERHYNCLSASRICSLVILWNGCCSGSR